MWIGRYNQQLQRKIDRKKDVSIMVKYKVEVCVMELTPDNFNYNKVEA